MPLSQPEPLVRRHAALLLLAAAACSACAGEAAEAAPELTEGASQAAAPSPAASTVEVVAPGVVSTPDVNQTFPALDPVTGDLWYSEYTGGFDDQTIRFATWDGSSWTEPRTAPFSGTFGDRAPRFHPAGDTLYFSSNRPRAGAEEGDWGIWRTVRVTEGWSEPELVPGPVNSPEADIHPVATNGALWFASARTESLGRSDIFRVAWDGTPTHLPGSINNQRSQPDLWVSPDEAWMVLVETDGPAGLGGDDLYVSYREGGTWSPPVNLGAPINSDEYEYGPHVTADGRTLYFTSHRDGASNIYRVAMPERP